MDLVGHEGPPAVAPRRTAIERAASRGELYLSLYSVWEMAKKVEKGSLILDRPLDEWLDAALEAEGLQVAELTRSVLVDSCRLPQPFHDDPADQIIVATARSHSATLVTGTRDCETTVTSVRCGEARLGQKLRTETSN